MVSKVSESGVILRDAELKRRYLEKRMVRYLIRILLSRNGPNQPLNGHTLAHGTDYRLYIRRIKRDVRKIDLQKGPGLPDFDKEVVIGWGGLFENKKDMRLMREGALEVVARFYPHDSELLEDAGDDH